MDLKDLKIDRRPTKARRRSSPWLPRAVALAVILGAGWFTWPLLQRLYDRLNLPEVDVLVVTESAPRLAGKSLALVLAEGPLTGFAAALLGMRLSRCFSLRLPPGGLGILDVYENGVHLAAWNATALQS